MLAYLAGVTKGPVQKVEILINIITVTFDMNQPTQASWQELLATPVDWLLPGLSLVCGLACRIQCCRFWAHCHSNQARACLLKCRVP